MIGEADTNLTSDTPIRPSECVITIQSGPAWERPHLPLSVPVIHA
jgi:hypothetical protein